MTDAELCRECLKRLDFESMAQHMVEGFSDYSWEGWVRSGDAREAMAICEEAFKPQLREATHRPSRFRRWFGL